jgi:hypothetical protein
LASRIRSGSGVGDAREADLARVEQIADRPDRLLVGDARVRPVELVEPDGLDAEPLQRRVAGLLQVLRRAVQRPRAVARTQVTALRRDQHVRGVAAVLGHRAGDQGLVVTDLVGVPVIGVRGVDQRDAGLQRGVDGRDRTLLVGAPLDGHRHTAQTDRSDLDVTDGACLHGGSSWGFIRYAPASTVTFQPSNKRIRSL